MRVHNSYSLIGVLSTACTYLGVPIDRAKDRGSFPRIARLFGAVAMIIDAVDLILDIIFVAELYREGHTGWAALMASAFVLAHGLDWIYGPIVHAASEHDVLGVTFAYYFGTSECIIFLVEDVTTIFLFSRVVGAFDAGSTTDALNLALTLLSAVVGAAFVMVGGLMLVCRGRSAFWVPNLAMTKLARGISSAISVPLGHVMSVFILLKCVFVAVTIGFYTYVTTAVVLKGNLVEGGLSTASTVMCVLSIVLALLLSLRSPVKDVDYTEEEKQINFNEEDTRALSLEKEQELV